MKKNNKKVMVEKQEVIDFLEKVMNSRTEAFYRYKEEGNTEEMKKMDAISGDLYGIIFAIKKWK